MWSSGVTPHASTHEFGGADLVDVLAGTDVVASRATATNYQNTSGRAMLVNITWHCASGASEMTVDSNAATPPTTPVAYSEVDGLNEYEQCMFVVLKDHYYRVDVTTGVVLDTWVEMS